MNSIFSLENKIHIVAPPCIKYPLYKKTSTFWEVSGFCFLFYSFMPNIFCLSHSTTSVNNHRGDNNDKNDIIKAKNNNKNDNNGCDYKIKDNSDAFDLKIN